MSMSFGHRRRAAVLAGTGVALLVLAGCGAGDDAATTKAPTASARASTPPSAPAPGSVPAAGAPGTIAGLASLTGVAISVGSKEFTEQRILGQIMVKTLRAAGAQVKDQTGLAGSDVVRKALENGEVGVYYEYTGTGWINFLKNAKPVSGSAAQFTAVKKGDAENDVTWLAPAPANNTYAIAASAKIVGKYPLKTISDYAKVVREHPEDAGLCTASEFVTRDDGLPGLAAAYGFTLPEKKVSSMDFGPVYASVTKGSPCNFAVVFATDGQILAGKLTLLEDDKLFFPAYNIAVSMRTDMYEKNKEAYDKIFAPLSALLTTKTMTELNAAVAVDKRPIDAVVDAFLAKNKVV